MSDRPHRTMTLAEALREVWDGVEDLASLASTLEPEDQLDEEEVEEGMTNREDRYRWGMANAVISTAFDRALRLAETAQRVLAAEAEVQAGGIPQDWPDILSELERRVDDVRDAFGSYTPEPHAVRCVGCPCIEQGGSPCCFCGQDIEAHG